MLKKKLKDNIYIFLSFIVPIFIMLFVLMTMQIAPFGEFSLLISDGSAQYIDRLTGFRNIILNGKSYLYTWSQIQGSTPYAFIGFDPFYLFYLFVSDEHITDMVAIVTALRMGCSGAAFAFYLRHTVKRNDISISIFSWCYALMGFSIGYYFLLDFNNAVILLPLILYGVERLLENQKHYLFFTVLLAVSFFVNFYMSYMIGIYAFLYFCYRYVTVKKNLEIKDFAGKLFRFLISPILALGCSAFLVIPVLLMMPGRDGLFDGQYFTVYLRYEFQGLLSKLFVGSFDTILPNGLPYIYCGVIVLVLIGFYFLSSAISYKEKLISFVLLSFMFISLTLNPLYVAWHGFKPPVYFEGRFSYLVSFTMILIGYKGFSTLYTVDKKQYTKVFLILAAIVLFLNRQQYTFIHDNSIIYTLTFLAAYYLLVSLITWKKYARQQLMLLMAVIVASELLSNAAVTFKNMDEMYKFPFDYEYTDSVKMMKKCYTEVKQHDAGFYRMEFVNKRGLNDGFGVGFPSISHFDSVYNYDAKNRVGELGVSSGHNWIQYEGSTPIVDALLNIKYVVAKDENYFGYTKIQNEKENIIFENPYAVSVGYMSQDDLNKIEENMDPLQLQEDILNKVTGGQKEKYYIELPILHEERVNNEKAMTNPVDEKSGEEDTVYYAKDNNQYAELKYDIKAQQDGPCFMTLNSNYYSKFDVFVNDKLVKQNCDNSQKSIYLGDYQEGQKLNVKIRQAEAQFHMKDVIFRQLDEIRTKKAFEQLRENSFKVVSHTETKLQGEIEVGENQKYMVTSIPYDTGWHVTVDGQAMKTRKVFGAFLGLQLSKGKHHIEMSYCPDCFKPSCIASCLSWILLYLIARRHRKGES